MNKILRICIPVIILLMVLGVFALRWDLQNASAANLTWSTAAPLIDPLGGPLVQCVEDKYHFYMVGGNSGPAIQSNGLYRFTIGDPGVWDQLADIPVYVTVHAAACYQGKIYIAGGISGDYFYDWFYIYDIETNTWSAGPDLPDTVAGASMGAWDGKLYVAGGTRVGIPWTPVRTVDVFDIATNTWIEGGGALMPFGAGFTDSAQAGPYLYIVGGYSGDFAHNVNQTQRYNMATDVWQVGPEFTSARALIALSVTGTHLYALGGDTDGVPYNNATDLVETLDLSAWPEGAWEDLNDSLPQPSMMSGSTCSEVIGEGEIWAVGGLSSGFLAYDTNLYRPSEPCVSFSADLLEPMSGEGLPGASVEYQLTLTNTGNTDDYYTLAITSAWGYSAPVDDLGPVTPGESLQFVISVDVPVDAMPGDQGVTDIKATSISNYTVTDNTTITTTALVQYLVDLQPISPVSQEGHPGHTLTYDLLVTNVGNIVDSYSVEISATWETTGTLTIGPLLPGESSALVITVSIPPDAVQGDWDTALVNITSQTNPAVADQLTLTSTAVFYRLFLPVALKD